MSPEVLVPARFCSFPVVVEAQVFLEFGDEVGDANRWLLTRRNPGFEGVDIWLSMENLEVEDIAMQILGF